MEFAMLIKKSVYQNEESEIEITWSYKDHFKFIDVYSQFNGKMHMDAHLASNFPEVPIAFISILRKKHEMSMATKAIDGIPHDVAPAPDVVAPVPDVVAPVETRSVWSNEEITELHCLVQAYLDEVQLDVSKEMWKLIAKMKNGVRTPIACQRKWEKTKSTVGVRVREDAQQRLSYVHKIKDAIADEAVAAQPDPVQPEAVEVGSGEFAMVIKEVTYENENLEMEVTWTLNDHFKFLDVYDKFDGSMPMDVYLSKSVTNVHQSLISCIRRMHEMSMASEVIDVPPAVAVPFDPKDTRRLWSREEIDELHYLVKAHKSEVPTCLMKDRWKFIAKLKNGMRAPEAYKSKWSKTKDKLGAHDDEEQLGSAVEKVKKALAEVEAQPEEN